VTGLFLERHFGGNEYLFQLRRMLNAVCEYELRWGAIFLRPIRGETRALVGRHFDPRSPVTCSPMHAEMMVKVWHSSLE
jgi:hypothetical protein